jgi:uncharacterized protein (DUF924 family)
MSNEIYNFWFENSKHWFYPSKEFDEKVSKFKAYLDLYPSGLLNCWKETNQGLLSLIILLDQFPRNIFRGYSEAYDYDELALDLVMKNMKKLENFTYWEKVFFLMPLQHSEDISIQKLNLELWKDIISKEKNDKNLKLYQKAYKNVEKHYQLIETFGRFPKRNIILKRKNTEEENLYLIRNLNGFI